MPPQPHPRCLPRRRRGSSMRHLLTDVRHPSKPDAHSYGPLPSLHRQCSPAPAPSCTQIWTPSPSARSKSARCSSTILRLSAQHGHWRHGRSLRRHRGSRTSTSRTWAKGHLAASQLRETRGRSLHSSLAARRLTRKHALKNHRRVQRLQRPKRQCWRHSSRRDLRHSRQCPSPSVCPCTCRRRGCATISCR